MVTEIKKYKTSDGKIFDDKKKAEKYEHELEIKDIKVYRVSYHPDLNEGRGYYEVGYVYVHANDYHEMFLRDWLHKQFGNPISFVMGVYGSNAIMESYVYRECKDSDVDSEKVLVRIEENWVDKIWS